MGNSVRATAGVVVFLAAAFASGQMIPRVVPEPDKLKLNLPVPPLGEPSAPMYDPKVVPAQLLPPALPPGVPPSVPDAPKANVPTGVVTTPGTVAPVPAEPPPPTLRLQVQTPAHVPPGKPIPYKIVVSNPSTATAYKVKVRMPAPADMQSLNKVEPPPVGLGEIKQPVKPDRELTWEFGKIESREQKVIQVEFTPAPGKPSVSAKAYISFEFGQVVDTNIERPKLAVAKVAAKEAARGEPVAVRVTVTNTGPMPIHKVRLVEDFTTGFQFKGAEAVAGQKTNQRVWELGTLARGQSKIVSYQLTGSALQGGELATTSNATSDDGGIAETVESKTRILVPDLAFALTGPETVESRQVGIYQAEVRNNGTLPLTNVVVSIFIPEGSLHSKVTNGATRYADRVSWVIPKLDPGEGAKYRLGLEPKASGKLVVRATAKDKAELVNGAKEVPTVFLGRADLRWKPDIPATIGQGKQAQITITVRNEGQEADKGVSPRVVLPDGLKMIQVSPKDATSAMGEIIFNAVEIKPGKSEVFTVTVERTTAGQKRVLLRLEAQSLDKQPLLKEQTIE